MQVKQTFMSQLVGSEDGHVSWLVGQLVGR